MNLYYGDFHALKDVNLHLPENRSRHLSDLPAAESPRFKISEQNE